MPRTLLPGAPCPLARYYQLVCPFHRRIAVGNAYTRHIPRRGGERMVMSIWRAVGLAARLRRSMDKRLTKSSASL